MRAKYIKQREQFEREAAKFLLGLGAVEIPRGAAYPWTRYTLQTSAGALTLQPHTDFYRSKEPGFVGCAAPWISGRFEDVAAASRCAVGNDVNPYSGKWNHHYWRTWTDDFGTGLSLLKYQIEKILPKNS